MSSGLQALRCPPHPACCGLDRLASEQSGGAAWRRATGEGLCKRVERCNGRRLRTSTDTIESSWLPLRAAHVHDTHTHCSVLAVLRCMVPCESSEPSLENPSLLDLGGSLYPVLLALDAEDLARLAQCCVALRSASEDDSLWRALCAQRTPTAAAWRDALRLGSYRHTYLVLCWLGVRPGTSPLGAPPALTALRSRRPAALGGEG